MKVLHVASFAGNVGDNANHQAFQNNLRSRFPDAEFEDLEIRRFYKSWGHENFNSQQFIDRANSVDLVVFGGGAFLEPAWESSHTGTTIDLSDESLDQISTPILFNGLGCALHTFKRAPAADKFRKFLARIITSDQYFVTFRNDGSLATLEKLYGARFANRFREVPDSGFFTSIDMIKSGEIRPGKKYIGVNVQNDLKKVQFSESGYDDFIQKISHGLGKFLNFNPEYALLFFPHIQSDLKSIGDVLDNLPVEISRLRASVAPLISGMGAERHFFGLYAHCDMVLGTRYHANVVPIGLGVPTIGFLTPNYDRISELYKSLGLTDRLVDAASSTLDDDLNRMLEDTVRNRDELNIKMARVKEQLVRESNRYLNDVATWFNSEKSTF